MRVLLILLCVGEAWAYCPRVVTTSPQWTELLFQLGKGACIKGASDFSDYPPEAKKLPRIGPLFSPNIELLLTLSPDWIVTDPFTRPSRFQDTLQALKTREYLLSVSDLTKLVVESQKMLATIFSDDKNESLIRLKSYIDRLPKRKSNYTFLAFAWANPPVLIGPTTFLSHLIELTGGKNELPDSWSANYPQVSEEWLMEHPTPIVYFIDEENSFSEVTRTLQKVWPNRNVRTLPLKPDYFSRTSLTPLAHLHDLYQGENLEEFKP